MGVYRSKKLISPDWDDDIYIDSKHIHKFNYKLLRDIEAVGFIWLRSYSNRLLSIGRDGHYIDLCFLGLHKNDKYKDYYAYNSANYYHKKYFDDKFELAELNGIYYPIPKNTKGFLKALYGDNFMTPDRSGFYNQIVKYIDI